MLRIGFLSELVATDELSATVQAYVDGILACEGRVVAAMKADLMAVAEGVAGQAVLRGHYADALKSPQLAARLDAINRRERG